MLKKDMKKIFDKMYIFSKLVFSFTLLFCLLGLLYVFYINYQKEDVETNNKLAIEYQLKESIKENSNLIETIATDIKNTQLSINEIENKINLSLNTNNKNDLLKINENIEIINNNIISLSNEIDKIKLNEQKLNKIKTPSRNKEEIINIILTKYENNINFDKEYEFLKDLSGDKNTNNFEKLSILKNIPFKGYSYLESVFDKEVNSYLKKLFNERQDGLFNKIILPYVKISPSSENSINDNSIIKIKKIKINIQNKKLELAHKGIVNIHNYEVNFKKSAQEMANFIEFKAELFKIK